MLYRTVVLCFLLSSVWGSEDGKFPPGFKFGAATASYQVEGGWNADDKSENIWDVFSHKHPEAIIDGSNGDVACDSYKQWKRDIEIAAELGLDFYRFSISWSRLLPTGFPDKLSDAGKTYYNNLIDGLLAKGVEPVITLYHWDLPQRLQNLVIDDLVMWTYFLYDGRMDYISLLPTCAQKMEKGPYAALSKGGGGWTNPLIADWFADYARVVFTLFGDRVKTWITINEPIIVCELGYGSNFHPPPINEPGVGNLLCNKNILMAHAKAYRIYDEEFRSKFKGEIGITNHIQWLEAETEEHEDLAELAREFSIGTYSNPIFSKKGGWPKSIEKHIEKKSKKEGWPRSRLPTFTKEEKEFVRGTSDFFGFNHYSSRAIRPAQPGEALQGGAWPLGDSAELDAKLVPRSHWPKADTFWFYINPEGIRKALVWLKKQYGDIKIIITENGYASKDRTLNDVGRVKYYHDYLEQVLIAIKKDGVNITGYTAWTLIDNYEWSDGYDTKFGLYDVDFNHPERTRTARNSARFYSDVIKHHSLKIAKNYITDEL